jgi:hypothetical protein
MRGSRATFGFTSRLDAQARFIPTQVDGLQVRDAPPLTTILVGLIRFTCHPHRRGRYSQALRVFTDTASIQSRDRCSHE